MSQGNINLLYDHQIFAAQKYGGVSRIFYELIKHLVGKKEVKLYLIQGLHINHFPLEDLKKKMAFYLGKKMICFPHVSTLLKPFNHMILKTFSAGKRIDIYHPTNYSAAVYNWEKSPVVLTVYDMIPELFPDNFRDIKRRLKNKKRNIERADKIITISLNTKKDLLEHYNVPGEKIRVIYPGAPSSFGKNERIPTFQHPKPFILYVGTRKQGYKNFPNFFLAYSRSEKITKNFDLVCFGGSPFNKKESQLMAVPGRPVKVFHVSGDDRLLASLYRSAAAFVYPSLYEGFGLPPLEAMTYGCPVITSRVSAIPEVLGDAAAYFDSDDPESISSLLEKVLYERKLANQLVQKGSSQVKKYSWAKMAEETYQVYEELSD